VWEGEGQLKREMLLYQSSQKVPQRYPKIYIFIYIFSDIQDSLKFISRVVPNPKFRSIDVIMTSYLQKITSDFFIKWILLHCLSLLLWLEQESKT